MNCKNVIFLFFFIFCSFFFIENIILLDGSNKKKKKKLSKIAEKSVKNKPFGKRTGKTEKDNLLLDHEQDIDNIFKNLLTDDEEEEEEDNMEVFSLD